MSKDKEQKAETWGSRMKEFGGGNFTFLSSDGEVIVFIVVGLPCLLKTMYKKEEQERIGCPVVTEDGYVLFICGKRLGRKIAKFESKFTTHAIMAIRHGAEGDVNAKYEVKLISEKETYDRLAAIAKEDFTPDMIAESVAEAQTTLAS